MEAYISGRSYNIYGGGASLSTLGDLLEHAAWDADCGVDVFEAMACFRPTRPPKPGRGFETSIERLNAELEDMPRFRWARTKRKLSVSYESRIGEADEVFRARPPRRDLVIAALDELAGLLKASMPALRKKPGFDADLFLGTLESLRDGVPATDEAIVAFRDAHRARREARRSLLPWWERREIDWARFHPAARTLLDDEFFWLEDDEYAPHGNDTGSDLMTDFRRWRKTHGDTLPLDFLSNEIRSWGFNLDWRDRPREQWDSDDELAVNTYDQAAVALAFALIKLEGSCDAETRAVALEALAREGDPKVAAHFGWPPSPERDASFAKLRLALGP
jgi:uncharacterized protein YfeS